MTEQRKQDGTDNSELQARAQLDSIRSMVRALSGEWTAEEVEDARVRELLHLDDGAPITQEDREAAAAELNSTETEWDARQEEARETIEQDALEIAVRTGWEPPTTEYCKPAEFMILLCTGGPACRIIGELDEYCQPVRARIEHQDWFTPWTEYRITAEEEADVLTYCRCFYFGE